MGIQVILDKARSLAQTDLKINGSFANAPYKIFHDGERYIGRIKVEDGQNPYVVVTKPESHIGTEAI